MSGLHREWVAGQAGAAAPDVAPPARTCDQLGVCQSRRCGQCGRWPADVPTLPFRTDADPPPTRGERIATGVSIAAWVACVIVLATLVARACGGAA